MTNSLDYRNQRIQCDIQFNYAGGDWEVVKDTLEVLRAGVTGIRLRGTPLVTDKLLSSLMSEFPLISTVKIDTTDELCNQLTERGLSELLNSNRLELFHSNNCVELEGLQASTTRLRKLSLTGLTHKCGQIMLRAPHLRRIEIQFSDARAGPVLGLSLSVAQAAARLEHIYVYLPSLTAEEVEQMQLDQMPRLRKLSLSVELTATLLEGSLGRALEGLTMLEVWVGSFGPELSHAMAKHCDRLTTLVVHGSHSLSHLGHFLRQQPKLKKLHISTCLVKALVISSDTLELMTVSDCPNLEELTLNCQYLAKCDVVNCPKLERNL